MKPRANPSFNSFDTVITHEGGRIVLNSGMQTRTSLKYYHMLWSYDRSYATLISKAGE